MFSGIQYIINDNKCTPYINGYDRGFGIENLAITVLKI